jgi:hypothetical protein
MRGWWREFAIRVESRVLRGVGGVGGAYGGFAGIVEAEEEKFGVLVGEAEGGQDVPDWRE